MVGIHSGSWHCDPEEAFWMAQDAITGWIEIAIEDGLDIPVENESQVRQVAMR